jgi:hypothetical protein
VSPGIAVPAVADAVLVREVLVDGQVLGCVVAHGDHPQVGADVVLGLAAVDERFDEAAVVKVAIAGAQLGAHALW